MPLTITAPPQAKDSPRSHEQPAAVLSEVAAAEVYLARHLRGRLRDIRITVHRDGVVLQGRASSYYVKQLAQHAVMTNVSLPIAVNEIEVVPQPAGRQP